MTEALADEEDGAGATDAGVEIRLLDSTADVRRLTQLFNQVWGTSTAVVGMELIRAIGHAGGYVAGAYAGEQMVGGSMGFLARHLDEPALHSHLTGILPGVRRTGLGRTMKLHQQAWAADRGLHWVTWTFDPLVRRNAWFNLGVLGAEVHEYLVDFYGPIDDSINAGDESDRLLVAWAVDARPGTPPPVEETFTVPTPEDIVVLRRTAARRGRGVAAPRAPGARRPDGDRRPRRRLHPRRRLRGHPGRRAVSARIVELREIRLPLVSPFQTSFGVQTSRRILLVRAEVERDGVVTTGWGECVAGDEPTYSSEYVDGAALVMTNVLVPRLHAVDDLTAADVAGVLAPVRGHPMAKAALEMAVLDAELRADGTLVRRPRSAPPATASRAASASASTRRSTTCWRPCRATSTTATSASS